MQPRENSKVRARSVGGLLALCLIWAWASLRSDLLPGYSTAFRLLPLAAEASLLGLFAILAALVALIGSALWPKSNELRSAALVGLGLFVVPALLTDGSREWVDASTRVALFSLTPLFAVVFEPHLGRENASAPHHGFAAPLLALVGTLLVFSIDIPHSAASGLAFLGVIVAAASVAAANCIGVRVVSCASPGLSLAFAAIATACAALVLGLAAAVFRAQPGTTIPVDAWSALELVALTLLFWLMRTMSAVQMTTRFLIAPLLANLIAVAFLHPAVGARGWTGMLLIAIASGWLLLAHEDEPERTGSSVVIS